MSKSEENKALVRRYFDAFDEGNLELIEEMLASDFVDHSPLPDQGPGRDGYTRLLAEDRAALSDVHTTFEYQATDGDDMVISRLTQRSTHDWGEMMGVAPTRQKRVSTGIIIHRISEGKIAEEWSEPLHKMGVSAPKRSPMLRYHVRSQAQEGGRFAMEKVAGMDGVRVATLNLWGRHGAWDERRSVLLDGFHELQPDVVAFQEAIKTDDYDQVGDLLGPHFHVVHQSGRSADGVGATIASRWPLGEVREMDLHVTPRLESTPGWIGSAAVAEIFAPSPVEPLLFVHHKPSWQWGFEHERELQAVAAARFVEELVGERSIHVVLAGDFDAVPEAASIRFWTGRQSLDGMSVCYRDAWESIHPGDPAGHTFTLRNPLVAGGEMPLELGRRIDYIMVRCVEHGPTLEISACARIFDEPVDGVWASDHFGVVADLSA